MTPVSGYGSGRRAASIIGSPPSPQALGTRTKPAGNTRPHKWHSYSPPSATAVYVLQSGHFARRRDTCREPSQGGEPATSVPDCEASLGVNDETAWAGPKRNRAAVAHRRAIRRIRAGDTVLLAIVLAFVLVLGAVLVAREAGASERRSADRRLAAVTEAAAGSFVDSVEAAEALARRRAADETVVRALANGDRRTLRRIASVDGVTFVRRDRVVAAPPGRSSGPKCRRRGGRSNDRQRDLDSAARSARGSPRARRPCGPGEEVLLLASGRIVAGAEPASRRAGGDEHGRPERRRLPRRRCVTHRRPARCGPATMMPLAAIDRAADDNKRNDVLLASLASLVTLALVVVAAVIWRRQRRHGPNARDRERAAQRSRRALARR